MKTLRLPLVAAFLLFSLAGARAGEEVIRQTERSVELTARWRWANDEAARRGTRRYWVAYSVVKMMSEHSFIGSFFGDERRNHPALREVLAGAPVEEVTAPGEKGRRVPKEIAFLFLVTRAGSATAGIEEMRISSLALHVELAGLPLYWLDGAPDDESTSFLAARFADSGDASVREEIIEGVGMHDASRAALPFLRGVLTGKDHTDLRSKAAYAIGGIRSAESLSLLSDAVEHDHSEEVREQAVFAISRMDSAFGLASLIGFARDRSLDREVRGKAVFWLSQIASSKAVRTLAEITQQDDDSEIQRQALYALAQSDEGGIDAVITIAKGNQNRKLRREAIYWLGQSEDPRALETLLAIIRE